MCVLGSRTLNEYDDDEVLRAKAGRLRECVDDMELCGLESEMIIFGTCFGTALGLVFESKFVIIIIIWGYVEGLDMGQIFYLNLA